MKVLKTKQKTDHNGGFCISWSCWDDGLRTEIIQIGREITEMKNKLSIFSSEICNL